MKKNWEKPRIEKLDVKMTSMPGNGQHNGKKNVGGDAFGLSGRKSDDKIS